MTRVLQYTDGSTVGSVSDVTLAFGTVIARVATRTALYDAIVTLLTAAGFTQRNQATRDDTWTSTGETGTESINFRTQYDGSTRLNFYVGVKVDGSGVLQGSVGGSNSSFDRWTIVADTTFDLLTLATKDFFWIIARRVSDNVHFALFIGNLERDNVANPNVLITSGTASAGSNVVVSVTASPIVANYEAGDIVQIISQATGDAALAESTQIISVTSTTVELAALASTYSAGARLGASPSPIARFCNSGTDPDSASSWYSPLTASLFGGSDLVASPGQTFGSIDLAAGNVQTAQDGFGTGATANKRTRRFGLRSLVLKSTSDEPLGRIPGIYAYPSSTLNFYPHDTGTFNRVTPSQRFIAAKFINSPTKYWMFGKAP